MSPKLRTLLLVLAVALPLDQATKLAAATFVPPEARVPLVPEVLYVVNTLNPGAAFGAFATAATSARAVGFLAVAALAIGVILVIFRRLAPGDRMQAFGLAAILAGALGNSIDRAVRGAVIDLVHVRVFAGYAWPDFNVADVCIVLGVAVLFIDLTAREATERALDR